MKLPFKVDLNNKVVVITGAGGVICSHLAKAVAACGAKVALLDLHKEAAQSHADVIVSEGGIAKGFEANVLDKASLIKCHEEVLKEFGPCDILINGVNINDNPNISLLNTFPNIDYNSLKKKKIESIQFIKKNLNLYKKHFFSNIFDFI